MVVRVRLVIIAVFVALISISCAGSSAYMKPSEALLSPTKEKALVRFMRPSGMGFGINFNVLDGERVIGNSVSKSQFDYLADPGKHLFIATAENKVFLEADLETGKTYYIITRIYPGVWRARVAFLPITRGSEYWDKVKEYEADLVKLQPDTAAIKEWEYENKQKIKELVTNYETTFKTSEVWPKLNREDGR